MHMSKGGSGLQTTNFVSEFLFSNYQIVSFKVAPKPSKKNLTAMKMAEG